MSLKETTSRRSDGGKLQFILCLLAINGFAVTQPLLDLLGRHPQFFAARGTTFLEVCFLLAVLTLAGPAIAFGLVQICARIHPALGRSAGRAAIALGTALFVLVALGQGEYLRDRFLGPGFALAVGWAFSAAYSRWKAVGLFLRLLSPSPLVFVLAFMLASPTGAIGEGGEPVAVPSQVGSPAPVAMIVFDELPLASLLNQAGAIDPKKFPHFAQLADRANWYRNATTVADSTELSLPAIMSGRYPQAGGKLMATGADHPRTLFTMLGGGYEMRVFESATNLCPASVCAANRDGWPARLVSLSLDVGVLYLHLVLPPPLRQRLPRVDQTWGDYMRLDEFPLLSGRDSRGAFSAFLDSIQPSGRPTFHFIHLQLPHVPWVYLPSGRQYLPWEIDYTSPNVWDRQRSLVEVGFQRHLFQVMLVDRLIGRLMERLKQLGLYEQTLLIVLSDHGASFRPGEGRRGATSSNFRDIASIPLFIKAPGQSQGRVLEVNAETIDVAPTVADILDLAPPPPFDGRSLLSDDQPPRKLKTIHTGSSVGGLVFAPDFSALGQAVVCREGAPEVPVEPGSLSALLDAVVREGGRWRFAGWAADLENRRPAESIMVFAEGRLVSQHATGIPRPDVEAAFPGRGPANAGFLFDIEARLLDGAAQVRVIAVGEGRASEVRYPEEFPWRGATPFISLSQTPCRTAPEEEAGTRLVGVWSPVREDTGWPATLVELSDNADETGFFRFPPCPDLIGVEVEDAPAPERGGVAALEDPEAFREVDPESGYIPAGVRGKLEPRGGEVPRQVAVALNGVIAGLAPTFLSPEGDLRFLVPVRETQFRRGPNQIQVFGVREEGCGLIPYGPRSKVQGPIR